MGAGEKGWPEYNPDKRDHLHAVGVIAHSYNSFEEGMFHLFAHHLMFLKVPYAIIEHLYLELNDLQRLKATRKVFDESEKDEKAKAVAHNLIDYFDWCSDVRNKLLHAELYPALFGGKQEMLHLSKRKNRRSPERGYMQLDVPTLRGLADRIEAGKMMCARFQIYLRCRDTPREHWRKWMKAYADEPLQDELEIPDKLNLADTPSDEPPVHVKSRLVRTKT